jgi:ketosteroid isomerase-like protein
MRLTAVLLLTALIVTPILAASPADEAKQTEIAFAKAFADRDADKFFSFIANDAQFLGKRTLNGKAEVRQVWSAYLEDPKAPFRWEPERVVADGSGTLALSTGPVYDPEGNHVGNFTSVWQKQADGKWKIIFDGPGGDVCPPPAAKKE